MQVCEHLRFFQTHLFTLLAQHLPVSLGIRDTFSDIGATVADALGVPFDCPGRSMLPEVAPV